MAGEGTTQDSIAPSKPSAIDRGGGGHEERVLPVDRELKPPASQQNPAEFLKSETNEPSGRILHCNFDLFSTLAVRHSRLASL